ncbi:MAG: glycosyltransferase [Deltaproteobacteria bacterium]|jgi:D-inositol-3-phosphate glycosyltransferase|nr:glycosyltransferase [Deltaproteobacteria bacterium]
MQKNIFLNSKRPHVLLITNHGVHDWEIRGGLIDTGGQNHYVLSLSDTLVALGFKVTTFNRGGFLDPLTKKMRSGIQYKDGHSRIAYLKGGLEEFIRKEDMDIETLSHEAKHAEMILSEEGTPIDLIISHYWDGALLGSIIKKRMNLDAKHAWVPHSLGALKMENSKDMLFEEMDNLHLDERIAYERDALLRVDAVASTSGDISRVLEDFYDYIPQLFCPPCVGTDGIYPNCENDPEEIYDFLMDTDFVSGKNARGRFCILEISRTDSTKRKDILIRAFGNCLAEHPDTMLLLRLDPTNKVVYNNIVDLIEDLDIRDNVILVGGLTEKLKPKIFGISDLYVCTSEMEGFGSSVQEACAARKATISSDLTPFAVQYLLQDERMESLETEAGWCTIRWGSGGVVVPAGNVEGFSRAINKMISDHKLRESIAKTGHEITIPHFTWENMVRSLLEQMKITIPK